VRGLLRSLSPALHFFQVADIIPKLSSTHSLKCQKSPTTGAKETYYMRTLHFFQVADIIPKLSSRSSKKHRDLQPAALQRERETHTLYTRYLTSLNFTTLLLYFT